jgi:hypothetical protein
VQRDRLRDVSDGQASNPIIARFAREVTGIEITYARWAIGASFPDAVPLARAVGALSRLSAEVKAHARASELASEELRAMGPMSWSNG